MTNAEGHEHCSTAMHVRDYNPQASHGPLVYVHGLGEHGGCFDGIASDVRLVRWRHLIPDLPGYRESRLLTYPSLGEIATHLARWLNGLGLGPVTLVGHSMGGVIALLLAEQAPHLVRGFVNIEGNVSKADCTISNRVLLDTPESFQSHGFERLQRELASYDDPSISGYIKRLKLCDPDAFYHHAKDLVAHSETGRIATRLAALPIPVLFIAGRKSMAKSSCELLRTAGIAPQMIDGGHWPFLEQPSEVVRLLVDFLRT